MSRTIITRPPIPRRRIDHHPPFHLHPTGLPHLPRLLLLPVIAVYSAPVRFFMLSSSSLCPSSCSFSSLASRLSPLRAFTQRGSERYVVVRLFCAVAYLLSLYHVVVSDWSTLASQLVSITSRAERISTDFCRVRTAPRRRSCESEARVLGSQKMLWVNRSRLKTQACYMLYCGYVRGTDVGWDGTGRGTLGLGSE